MDYKNAGVDRALADDFVDSIKSKVKKTHRKEVLSEIGDFGGFFQAPSYLKEPVFVASTDGVGTKLLLAEEIGGEAHRAVGQDVVAMCVNDLVACGAEPLIFLDYLGVGKLDPKTNSLLMDGIVEACAEAGCALIGGETAEMPGFYPPERYDVAGFSIGVMEKSARWNPQTIVPGDIVLGIESTGFHSNGYSLVRKVLKDQNWSLNQTLDGFLLSEALLAPTRLYVKPLLEIFKSIQVKGASHITGGGLVENLPRAIDESRLQIRLDKSKIPTSSLVKRFVEAARLLEREAFSTWNMGIGFCLILSASEADKIKNFPWPIHKMGVVESKSGADSVLLS